MLMQLQLARQYHCALPTLNVTVRTRPEKPPFDESMGIPRIPAGEIVPQGICTQYGLAVGYYASSLLRVLMIIAFPIAWPLGKILDAVLGHSAPALPRGQLQQFVSLHGEDEGFARSATPAA